MELKTVTPEMVAALKKPLPPEAIKPHASKPYLSSIKVPFIIERLNDVFGLGAWFVRNEIIEAKAGEKMIVVKATLSVPAYGIEVEQFGGHDNVDRGDAYKGACTDALSKIGCYLYIGMDVYKGHGDKTDNAPRNEAPKPNGHAARPQAPTTPSPRPANGGPVISEAQGKRFYALSKTGGWTAEELSDKLKSFGFNHSSQITKAKYEELCAWVQTTPPANFENYNSHSQEITDEDIPF